MKTLYVRDLGCPATSEHTVSGETFAEIAEACKAHVMEMVAAGDPDYIAAMEQMKNTPPEEQQKLFASYRQAFDNAPLDSE